MFYSGWPSFPRKIAPERGVVAFGCCSLVDRTRVARRIGQRLWTEGGTDRGSLAQAAEVPSLLRAGRRARVRSSHTKIIDQKNRTTSVVNPKGTFSCLFVVLGIHNSRGLALFFLRLSIQVSEPRFEWRPRWRGFGRVSTLVSESVLHRASFHATG